MRTILPSPTLPTALVAFEDGLPALLAVSRRGWSTERRHKAGLCRRSHNRDLLAADGALGGRGEGIEGDRQRRSGAAGDGRDAERLERRDGPGFDVDG